MGKEKKLLIFVAIVIVLGAAWFVWEKHSPIQKLPPEEGQPATVTAPSKPVSEIVKHYRKIIVLLEDEKSMTPEQLRSANLVGDYLYNEKRRLLEELSEQLSAELENKSITDFSSAAENTEQFLNYIESPAELHDADKLSFKDVVEHLVDVLQQLHGNSKARAALQERVESDAMALNEIQALYDREMEKIFGRFETRGMVVRREAWDQYAAYLKTKFKRDEILQEYRHLWKTTEKQKSKKVATKYVDGTQFSEKTILLTFDDGPHPKYTDRILEILKKNKVPAVFFQIGKNIGSQDKQHSIKFNKAAAVSKRLNDSGYFLANHTYTHPFLPKLDDKSITEEIETPNRILQEITHGQTVLFRPPYGSQNEKLLSILETNHMLSVIWNIDSKDWADPVPKSIANRVIREVEQQKKGIILFHDIHERTIEALPLVIETLKNNGYRFIAWNGKDFLDEEKHAVTQPAQSVAPLSLYRESWAVVIGIDTYRYWPKLNYAVNDAKAVRETLIQKYHFKPENIISLLNEEATREKILSTLGDFLGNPDTIKKEDRVFIFFAGHGTTRKLPSGRDLGYIIPVDADLQNYQGQSISMTNFQDISEAIPANHVLFVMDSCYSGLALTRGGAFKTENYIREVSRRKSRQMLTAGGMNEQVADNGPNGHSIFTWTLLQGLEGQADLNNDGFITASELASYIGPSVSALSKQTPAFGNLQGSEGGEFVFEPMQETEFLSELSKQLDEEAIYLNAQLDSIRKQISEKSLRNQKLRKELTSAMVSSGKLGTASTKGSVDVSQIAFMKHLQEGDFLFKEKRYSEALQEFLSATKLNASNALAANNVGYVYYKLEQYEEASLWFEKTIALDPKRAIAFANLGDAYLKMNRKSDAKKAFQKYLELSPNSKHAAEVKGKLSSLN